MSNIPTSYQGIIASVPANQEAGSLESGSVSEPSVNQQDYQLHQSTPGVAVSQQSQHTSQNQQQPSLTFRQGSTPSISPSF